METLVEYRCSTCNSSVCVSSDSIGTPNCPKCRPYNQRMKEIPSNKMEKTIFIKDKIISKRK